MTITFDKTAKKFVIKALVGTLKGHQCYFCGRPLNERIFAGAYKSKTTGKIVLFCDALPCLLGLEGER